MITRFRHSWKRNKIPLLIQTNNLILNITHSKRRSTISIYLSTTSHMIWYVLVFITLWRKKGSPKLYNNLFLHQDNMTTAKKWSCKEFWSICLILTHPSASHYHISTNLSDLHPHKINHPKLCLVLICLVSILHNCANGQALGCLVGGGAISYFGGN